MSYIIAKWIMDCTEIYTPFWVESDDVLEECQFDAKQKIKDFGGVFECWADEWKMSGLNYYSNGAFKKSWVLGEFLDGTKFQGNAVRLGLNGYLDPVYYRDKILRVSNILPEEWEGLLIHMPTSDVFFYERRFFYNDTNVRKLLDSVKGKAIENFATAGEWGRQQAAAQLSEITGLNFWVPPHSQYKTTNPQKIEFIADVVDTFQNGYKFKTLVTLTYTFRLRKNAAKGDIGWSLQIR